MKTFFYYGIDVDGISISGNLLAIDKKEAENKLNKRGIIVHSIRQKSNFLNIFRNSKKSFEEIINDLSKLLSSGLPITESLEFLASNKTRNRNQEIVINILNNLKDGAELNKAIAGQFIDISSFHLSLIQSGEKSGKLEEAFTSIAKMIDEDKIKRYEIISSLSYPAILLVVMLSLIYFILEFALPRMINTIDLGNNLPIPTKILIISGNTIPTIITVIFYLIFIFLLSIVLRNRFKNLSKIIDKVFIITPVIKNIITFISRRRILQVFSHGLNGGLSILDASTIVALSMPNQFLKERILLMIKSIEEGVSFSNAIENIHILSQAEIASIKIGDETDTLPKNFNLICDQFEKSLSITLKTVIKIIEPLIIITFGLMVLILALGIILPVMNSANMVNY